MDLCTNQAIPEQNCSPKEGPSVGAYVFQPAAQAHLPYAVQLRLTPELKGLLQQAQAEGTHVSLRFRHEPYRDVILTVGGQEFFFASTTNPGAVEVIQLPTPASSYECSSIAGIRQRLGLQRGRDADAAAARSRVADEAKDKAAKQLHDTTPGRPTVLAPAADALQAGAAQEATAKGGSPSWALQRPKGRPQPGTGSSMRPRAAPPPADVVTHGPGFGVASGFGAAAGNAAGTGSSYSPVRPLAAVAAPSPDVPRAAVLAAKRNDGLPLVLTALLRDQPLTAQTLQARTELAYSRAGVPAAREYLKRGIDMYCTMSNNRMHLKPDIVARELPKLEELLQPAGSTSPAADNASNNTASDGSHPFAQGGHRGSSSNSGRPGSAHGAGRGSGGGSGGAGGVLARKRSAPGALSDNAFAASPGASDGKSPFEEQWQQPAAKRPKGTLAPQLARAAAEPPRHGKGVDATYDFDDLSEGMTQQQGGRDRQQQQQRKQQAGVPGSGSKSAGTSGGAARPSTASAAASQGRGDAAAGSRWLDGDGALAGTHAAGTADLLDPSPTDPCPDPEAQVDPALRPYADVQPEQDPDIDLYRRFVDWEPVPHGHVSTAEQYNAYEQEYRSKYEVYHQLGQKYGEVMRDADGLRQAVDRAHAEAEQERWASALWRHGAAKWRLLEVWKSVRQKLHQDLGDLRARVSEYVEKQRARDSNG